MLLPAGEATLGARGYRMDSGGVTLGFVFSVAAKVKDDEVHPTLKMIGLYLNTLAHNGVPVNARNVAFGRAMRMLSARVSY